MASFLVFCLMFATQIETSGDEVMQLQNMRRAHERITANARLEGNITRRYLNDRGVLELDREGRYKQFGSRYIIEFRYLLVEGAGVACAKPHLQFQLNGSSQPYRVVSVDRTDHNMMATKSGRLLNDLATPWMSQTRFQNEAIIDIAEGNSEMITCDGIDVRGNEVDIH